MQDNEHKVTVESEDAESTVDHDDVQHEITPLTGDEKYIAAKVALAVHPEKSPLIGMDKKEFLEYLDRILFERYLLMLKLNHKEFILEGSIEDAEEELVILTLNTTNVLSSYNETQKKWQVLGNLIDGLIVYYDRSHANALLRMHLARKNNVLSFNGRDLEMSLASYWMKFNNIKENPLHLSDEEIKDMCNAIGLDLGTIDQEYTN